MSPVLGKLPALGFEFEVLGYEWPVEWRHPVGDEIVLLNPGLVVVVA